MQYFSQSHRGIGAEEKGQEEEGRKCIKLLWNSI